jgi:hypothetical protein
MHEDVYTFLCAWKKAAIITMKILSATLQNTSPKNCAALILADIHLTFEMVQCTGTERVICTGRHLATGFSSTI